MPTPTHARRLESPYICEYRLGGDEAVGIVEVVPDGAVPLAEVPTIGNHFSFVGAAVMLTAALQEAHAKKLLHPGLVTDVMDNLVAPNAHAYLCGPPPMVDAARALLQRHGLAAADIHADRFTTLHDKPLAA